MTLINAIKHDRADILLEVYENCFFLPVLAKHEKSTLGINQTIAEDQINTILRQLDTMGHLTAERINKFKSILSGKVSREK